MCTINVVTFAHEQAMNNNNYNYTVLKKIFASKKVTDGQGNT